MADFTIGTLALMFDLGLKVLGKWSVVAASVMSSTGASTSGSSRPPSPCLLLDGIIGLIGLAEAIVIPIGIADFVRVDSGVVSMVDDSSIIAASCSNDAVTVKDSEENKVHPE